MDNYHLIMTIYQTISQPKKKWAQWAHCFCKTRIGPTKPETRESIGVHGLVGQMWAPLVNSWAHYRPTKS